jgi:hypothetical protein
MTTLSELLRAATEAGQANLHTALPGRVESYDHTEQRASVKPLIKKAYRDGAEQSMPVIDRVPVVFPRSGGASLTFPVKPGDGVLLVFSERAMERWKSRGGEQTPGDPRKHDLTDAIAIPGLNPFSAGSESTTNDDVELVYNGFRMVVNQDGRFAIGNGADELLVLFEELLEALIDSICITGLPLTEVGRIMAVRTRLESIKGTLNPAGATED